LFTSYSPPFEPLMENSQPSIDQTPSFEGEKCSFRVFLVQKLQISKALQTYSFRKRYSKYFHSLAVEYYSRYNSKFFQGISRLKRLYSLFTPFYSSLPKISLLQKIMKAHQKNIRNVQGGLKIPKIQKFLPLLDGLCPSLNYQNWRLLTTRLAFRKLTFKFHTQYAFEKVTWQKNIKKALKSKAVLFRGLSISKNLESLNLQVKSEDKELILFIIKLANQKLISKSLKCFKLVFVDFSFLNFNCISPTETNIKINSSLKNLTFLESSRIRWLSLLSSAGETKNLLHLELDISPDVSWDFQNLARFQDLSVLDQFTFSFEANSINCEKEFFCYFTLPPAIQELDFTLKGFTWREIPLMHGMVDNNSKSAKFFDRLQDHKYLGTLNLTTTKSCSYLADKFARFFIHCFPELQTVSYRNYQSERVMDEQGNLQIKPIFLKEFWKAFEPSQKTLREIQIFSFEIAFPKKALGAIFPRLWRLNLEGNIQHAAEFGAFCQSLSELNQICASRVKFIRKKKLKQFLDGFKEIPLGKNVQLEFNAEHIKQDFLVGCLAKFIKEENIKGSLKLHFQKVGVKDLEGFGEILNLAEEKGSCLKLQMDTEDSVVVLQIEKRRICRFKRWSAF